MGYTHYWSFNKLKGITAAELETKYLQALAECNRVARHWNTEIAVKGSSLDSHRLSGFSAHTDKYGGFEINGKGDNAHETFSLREHFSENEPSFCKTARKPYDTVVTACLAVLKYRLGDAIDVTSDGTADDWADGVILARHVLSRAIPNPMNTSDESKQFYRKLRSVK